MRERVRERERSIKFYALGWLWVSVWERVRERERWVRERESELREMFRKIDSYESCSLKVDQSGWRNKQSMSKNLHTQLSPSLSPTFSISLSLSQSLSRSLSYSPTQRGSKNRARERERGWGGSGKSWPVWRSHRRLAGEPARARRHVRARSSPPARSRDLTLSQEKTRPRPAPPPPSKKFKIIGVGGKWRRKKKKVLNTFRCFRKAPTDSVAKNINAVFSQFQLGQTKVNKFAISLSLCSVWKSVRERLT